MTGDWHWNHEYRSVVIPHQDTDRAYGQAWRWERNVVVLMECSLLPVGSFSRLSRVAGVRHDLPHNLQGPGVLKVFQWWQIVASTSQLNVRYAAVFSYLWQWRQRTKQWQRRAGGAKWRQCRSEPLLTLTSWTPSAASGSSAVSSLLGSWFSVPIEASGWLWCPGREVTQQCSLGGHIGL